MVLNQDSGTLKDGDAGEMARTIADIVKSHGHEADMRLVPGADIKEALTAARDSNDAVLAGGGDGTVSTAAALFAGHRTALGILPLGTMNLFARALGIPLKLDEAVEALITGEKRHIDIGEVNGEIFVHHVTLGLHPRIVAGREKERYASRLGKKLVALKVWWRLVRQAPRMTLRLAVDSERVKLRTASLVIANNRFVEKLGGLPHSEVPDRGKLALYAAQTRDWKELLAMSAQAGVGRWESNSKLDFLEGREITIQTRRARLRASIDGELAYLRTPLRAKIRPGSLWVLCPASAEGKPEKPSAAPRRTRSLRPARPEGS
ncbi:MAG: diacylglycerol kinase family protein [Parvibaculaceae bacterium]